MDVLVKDIVFGEMTYKRRWLKMELFNFFGKIWDVKVVAKAFSGKPISDEQRDSYQWFKDNLNQIDEAMYKLASAYINDNCQELAMTWNGARMVNSPAELAQVVSLKTILFKQDGCTLVLFDCPWDEHGIAIQLKPDIEIGCQDMYL